MVLQLLKSNKLSIAPADRFFAPIFQLSYQDEMSGPQLRFHQGSL